MCPNGLNARIRSKWVKLFFNIEKTGLTGVSLVLKSNFEFDLIPRVRVTVRAGSGSILNFT